MPNANGGDRHVQLAERKASAGMDRIGPSAVFADSLEVLEGMAGTTGLEPAASAVTGQRSNQLNYVPTRQINKMRNNQCLCGFARFAYNAHSALTDPDCS